MTKSNRVGLGLRRPMLAQLTQNVPNEINFFEVAPENWMTIGGKLGKSFNQLTEQHQFFAHGLSLSIGGLLPLDIDFIRDIKHFLDRHKISVYSEHLSYCSGTGHLYDLMPMPFTYEAVQYIAQRVKQVEDILERPLILENISFYAAPGSELTELEFVNAVLQEADCQLLLDVNNIYVNSVNHGYDPYTFLKNMPTERIAYLHVAGHYVEDKDLIIDTHGADVVQPVWQLLTACYEIHGIFPTLLERDFNLPPLADLIDEVKQIHHMQNAAQLSKRRA